MKGSMKHLIVVLLVLVMVMPLTVGAPVAVQAAPTITVYDQDESGWKAAVVDWDTENFDDTTLNSGLSVTATWLGAGIVNGRWYDRLVAPGEYDYDTGQWGPTTTIWTFAEPIYAFGGTWDPGTPGGPGTSIKVSIGGSWIFVGVIPRDYVNKFWGFVSDVPFTQVLLEPYSSLTGWCETYALDNLVYSKLSIGTFWVRVTSQTGAYICSDSTGFSFPLLQKGDTGLAVRYLQVTLNSNPQTQVASTGPGAPLEETTSYGTLTENAVERFQKLRNLEENGRVDEDTRDALNSMPLPAKHVPNGWALKIIDTHDDLEIRDGTVWWEVEDVTDGVRGWVPRQHVTEGTQSELQQQVKLILRWTDDAPVIPHDFQFELDLAFGETSDDVKYLQMILKVEVNEPVYPASIGATGFYGAITKNAVVEFQAKYGLPQNGELVGEETRNKLNEFLRNGKYEFNQTRASATREAVTSYITDFLLSSFPVYSVLAMAMVETGEAYHFDNALCAPTPWGRGIMQIDTDTNVGAASGLRWFENGSIHYGRYNREITRHYYTNTAQGIEANIKDALGNLRQKYNYADRTIWEARTIDCNGTTTVISAEEFKIIVAVWGYNGLVTDPAKNYLRAVAQSLPNVNSLFGTSYDAAKLEEWRCKLEWANDNRTILKAIIGSAGELRLYDSQGRVTGLVGGEAIQEVPNSIFDETEESVTILFPSDSYFYEVVGIEEGTYGLQLALASVNGDIMFCAAEIPISPNAVHRYAIDWDALSSGEKGVTVEVDSDGDGIVDRTFIAGVELTGDEFILQTETVIDFDPDVLNLRVRRGVVTVYIELPEGYDIEQIDGSSIRLNGTVLALESPIEIGDYNDNGIADLMVKFDRAAVHAVVEVGEPVEITVTGEVAGIPFSGADTIRVIGP